MFAARSALNAIKVSTTQIVILCEHVGLAVLVLIRTPVLMTIYNQILVVIKQYASFIKLVKLAHTFIE